MAIVNIAPALQELSRARWRLRAASLVPVALAIILLVALAVRLLGIWYDFPFLMEIDETEVIQPTLGMIAAHSLDPHYYTYGPFLLYIEALWLLPYLAVRALLGHPGVPAVTVYAFGAATTSDPWSHVYGRLPFVALGVGAVWLAFLVGRRLAGPWAGLLGAALLALSPLHAFQSHYVLPNAPTSFFALLATFYAVRYLQDTRPQRGPRDLVLSTIAASLGTAIKYNAVVMFLVPLLALYLAHRSERPRVWLRTGVLLGAVFVATFLVVTPPAIFNPVAFVHGAGYQFKHYLLMGGGASAQGNSFVFYTRYMIEHEGVLVLPVAIVGLAVLAWRTRRHLDLLLLVSIVAYYLVLGVQKTHFERNLLVALPLISVACGYVLVRLVRLRWPLGLAAATLLAAVMLVSLGQQSLEQTQAFVATPPQLVARSWLQAHLPPHARLLADGYTVPPLDRRDVATTYANDIFLTPDQMWQRGFRYVVLDKSLGYYLDDPARLSSATAEMVPLFEDGGVVVYQVVHHGS